DRYLEHLELLSSVYNNLGVIRTRTGHPEEAEPAIRQAISTLHKAITRCTTSDDVIVKEHRKSSLLRYAGQLATFQKRLGNSLRDRKQFAEAEKAYREAIAIRQKEVQPAAGTLYERSNAEQLAELHSTLADLLLKSGQDLAAEKTLREAAEAWEKLLP